MDKYVLKTLERVYVPKANTMSLIKNIINQYNKQNEKQLLDTFIEHLNSLEQKPDEPKSEYKVDYITKSIDIVPKNIIDIGAGTGTVLSAVGKQFNIPKESLYALDLQPIVLDDVTVINYTAEGKIPLEDKSVDLVIMLSLLHHILPKDRADLLSEVRRVLSPNGRVIIREHDDAKNAKFRIFLQLIHYIWYIRNGETHDPLYLMSRSETIDEFKNAGFSRVKFIRANINIQRIYGEVYKV